MGANSSTLLDDDIEEIATSSSLSRAEIERLYSRFQKLDRNGSGTLDADEFYLIPELAMNPLVPRIVQLFDGVNFSQFVALLSAFGPGASRDAKIDFAFKFYDVDGDGVVSERDVRAIYRMLVGDNLDDDTLAMIVDRTLHDVGAAVVVAAGAAAGDADVTGAAGASALSSLEATGGEHHAAGVKAAPARAIGGGGDGGGGGAASSGRLLSQAGVAEGAETKDTEEAQTRPNQRGLDRETFRRVLASGDIESIMSISI